MEKKIVEAAVLGMAFGAYYMWAVWGGSMIISKPMAKVRAKAFKHELEKMEAKFQEKCGVEVDSKKEEGNE